MDTVETYGKERKKNVCYQEQSKHSQLLDLSSSQSLQLERATICKGEV